MALTKLTSVDKSVAKKLLVPVDAALAVHTADIETNTNSITDNTTAIAVNAAAIVTVAEGQTAGVIVFATYALLDAYTPATAQEKASFKVTDDSNTSLNGYYSWVSGTAYTKDADLVVNVIEEANTSDAVSGSAVWNFANTDLNKLDLQLMPTPSFRNNGFAWIDTSGTNTLILTENVEFPFGNDRITISAGSLSLSGAYRGTYYLNYVQGTQAYTLADLQFKSLIIATELTYNTIIIGYTNENVLYSPLITAGITGRIDTEQVLYNRFKSVATPPNFSFTDPLGYARVENNILKLSSNMEVFYNNQFITIASGELSLVGKSNRGQLKLVMDGRTPTTPYLLSEVVYDQVAVSGIEQDTVILGNMLSGMFYSSMLSNKPYYDDLIEYKDNFAVGNKLVLFGDSITNLNGPYTGSDIVYLPADGYFNWANVFMNQAFNIIYNAGIGGNTTIQMLARIQADVIAKNPDYVFFMGGINDINTLEESDASVIFSRILQVYSALENNGIRVITSLVTPSVSSATWKKQTWEQLNTLIRNHVISNDNLILCDMSQPICNVSTGDPITGWTDNTHPYKVGAYHMAKAIAEKLKGVIKETPLFPSSQVDDSLINTNAWMTGDNSGKATGWTVTGSAGATFSKETRAVGLGEWQVVNSISADGNTYNCISGSFLHGLAAGDEVYAIAEIDGDIVELDLLYLDVYTQNTSYVTTYTASSLYTQPAVDTVSIDNINFTGTLKTPVLSIPANSPRIRVVVRFAFQGEIKIGRVMIIKKSP